jgi:hypothetical protein
MLHFCNFASLQSPATPLPEKLIPEKKYKDAYYHRKVKGEFMVSAKSAQKRQKRGRPCFKKAWTPMFLTAKNDGCLDFILPVYFGPE